MFWKISNPILSIFWFFIECDVAEIWAGKMTWYFPYLNKQLPLIALNNENNLPIAMHKYIKNVKKKFIEILFFSYSIFNMKLDWELSRL